MPGKMLHPF